MSSKFQMTQTSKCLQTLVIRPIKFPTKHLDYSISNAKNLVAYDYDVFFQNTDKANCPITKCTLMTKGCKNPLVSEKIHLLDSNGEYQIHANSNEMSGYNTTFCYKCFNEFMSVQKDNIKVTQSPTPPKSMMLIWIVIGCIAGVILLIFGGVCICILHKHVDHQKGHSERSHEILKRME